MIGVFLLASFVHCIVGSGVGSPDRQALRVLECDTKTGAAKVVQEVKGCEGTTYFQIDRDGRFLYSAIGEKKDGKPVGTVVRFPLDGWKLGAMERLCELPCEAPCHLSLTPDGRRVAFAAYSSGMCGTVGIDDVATASSPSNTERPTAGMPSLRTYVLPDDAMGPNAKRQKKAHAHQTFYLSDGTLGVLDLGCDRIRFFNPATMSPAAIPDVKVDPGEGPRHAILSRDGKCLFVLCELSSRVYSFRCTTTTSSYDFQRLGRWSMLPADADRRDADNSSANTKAAAIKLTADGKILMASNRGHDSIAFYAVGADGALALRNVAKLRGKFPRDFELMPGERFMIVGHKMSNEIQVYRFDRAACTLEPVGEPIAAWRPLCFKFLDK